jgi:transposase-like protein
VPDQRRRFSPQFRAEAVQLVIETGKPIAEVARDLGIHDGTLGNWVNAWRRDNPAAPAEPVGEPGEDLDFGEEDVRHREEVQRVERSTTWSRRGADTATLDAMTSSVRTPPSVPSRSSISYADSPAPAARRG